MSSPIKNEKDFRSVLEYLHSNAPAHLARARARRAVLRYLRATAPSAATHYRALSTLSRSAK